MAATGKMEGPTLLQAAGGGSCPGDLQTLPGSIFPCFQGNQKSGFLGAIFPYKKLAANSGPEHPTVQMCPNMAVAACPCSRLHVFEIIGVNGQV